MLELNLPHANLSIAIRSGRTKVYDILRRKYIVLTPEEWVRQHFVHFLIDHKGYPSSCIGNEIALTLNGTRKRCDSVVYGQEAQPVMIIEYKAPHIQITQKVFQQISRYNIRMRVGWLVVSNGLQHYCCRINYDEGSYTYLTDLPSYEEVREDGKGGQG